jgi:diguanylate cyclase (GGDEF)-like protein
MTTLFRAIMRGLTIHQTQDADVLAEATRVVAFSLAMLIWVPIFAVIYTLLGALISANVVLSGAALVMGVLALLRSGRSPALCGNAPTASACFVYTGLSVLTGGIYSPLMVWYATLPVLSVFLAGPRWGAAWTLWSAATVGAFGLLEALGWQLPTELNRRGGLVLQITGTMGVLWCVYLLVCVLKKMEFGARRDLREANAKLELQAATDGLTGIPNRHSFDCVLAREWARHERAELPLSMALIDADFFKAFNDEYGHLAGDECLRSVARAIRASIRRPTDFCARFGGEEFAVILPNTDEKGAIRVAEMIREQVRALVIPHPRSNVSKFVSVSIGLATIVPTPGRSRQEFLHDVDMALYRAKESGRDQTVQVVLELAHSEA